MEDNGQKPRGSQQKAVLPAERLRAVVSRKHQGNADPVNKSSQP